MPPAQPAPLEVLAPVASEQDGYFTTAQASQLGIMGPQLDRLLKSGHIERVLQRVYRIIVGAPAVPRVRDDLYVRYLALDDRRLPWVHSDPAVVISHESAAMLLDIGNLPADTATFTSATRRTTTIPATRIRTAPLPSEDWAFILDGRVPVTRAARTIIDLAMSRIGRDYIERAASAAVDRRLATWDEIGRRAAERPVLRWLESFASSEEHR